ncbi:MAG: metallophosphoesterase family protein, partial [Bacilli bacterium]
AFIFLFGHTHEKLETKVGNTYLFNPGSLTYPRDSNTGSFLVINIDEKTNEIKWKFIDIE